MQLNYHVFTYVLQSYCMKILFKLLESSVHWVIFPPRMSCFLVLNWVCEFGCQNIYLKFCKSGKMCLCICSKHYISVQIVITLYKAWAREVMVSAGIYGEAVCPFMSLSATAASEICCPLLIDWSWYLKHFECFTAQVSTIWNKINYNCYRQGGLWS